MMASSMTMTNEIQHTPDIQQGEIILYQPDETVRLEVRLEDDTVWLTQAQIALLFQKVKSTISFHITNIFKEGELEEEVVVRKNRTTTQHGAIEGKRQSHEVTFYNLDVIISVGYRVKSLRGTKCFLIVDDDLWHCGASFKDLGRILFAIDKMGIDKSVILSQL